MPLFRDTGVGRRSMDRGSQKTCLAFVPKNLLGKAFSAAYIVEGQVNRVQPFKPTDRFEGFLFLGSI
jgi:hypothetical protein